MNPTVDALLCGWKLKKWWKNWNALSVKWANSHLLLLCPSVNYNQSRPVQKNAVNLIKIFGKNRAMRSFFHLPFCVSIPIQRLISLQARWVWMEVCLFNTEIPEQLPQSAAGRTSARPSAACWLIPLPPASSQPLKQALRVRRKKKKKNSPSHQNSAWVIIINTVRAAHPTVRLWKGFFLSEKMPN